MHEERDQVSLAAYPDAQEETITLGLGCFWGSEALFGQLPGVQRTRVGFAGGTSPIPSYRQMGDHSEVVEIDFLPEILPLTELLTRFWDSHNPVNINGYKGRQYWSMILYRGDRQREAAEQLLQRRTAQGLAGEGTEIAPLQAFYAAEEKHQKYYLKRYPDAVEKLSRLYPDHGQLVNATLAARLNGVAKGYAGLERIRQDVEQWPIGEADKRTMLALLRQIRW